MVDVCWQRAVVLDGSEIDGQTEGPDARIRHEDIGWGNHVCEAIPRK